MSREWKPGDVALVRVAAEYEPEVGVCGSHGKWFVAGPRLGSQHGWHTDRIEIVRPLVVIDPEDRAQVERLRIALLSTGRPGGSAALGQHETVQAALRSLITPPKPPEPTGLGAVVLAHCGSGNPEPLTRWCSLPNEPNWIAMDGDTHTWSDIWDVKVLCEGVQP